MNFKKLEKNWLVAVTVVAFVVRYFKVFSVDVFGESGSVSITSAHSGCKMTNNLILNSCGTYNFFNGVFIVIAVALLGYYVYWNFDELKVITVKLLDKLKK